MIIGGIVPDAPKPDLDRDVVLGASGVPASETVLRLRQTGLRRDIVVDVARGCQGDPKRFWGRLEAISDAERYEAAKRSVMHAIDGVGPVAMLDRSWSELAALVKPRKLHYELRAWSGESLLVLGPTGAGKTALCLALCLREAKSSRSVVWCSGRSLLQSQRRHPLGQGDPPEYERARDARLLVVDDPDWERQRDADQLFAELCADRYRESRPMLVTSGATLEEFTARYGSAVLRRIQESSRDSAGKATGRVVDCHG